MIYRIFTFRCRQNQNDGPGRSSSAGNETPQVSLAQEKLLCVVRTVEIVGKKVKAWAMPGFLLRAKELQLSMTQEDFSVCMCVRICQTCHSDANRNWAGEFLPVAGSRKWPLVLVRKHCSNQASRMTNKGEHYSNLIFSLNLYSLGLCSGL